MSTPALPLAYFISIGLFELLILAILATGLLAAIGLITFFAMKMAKRSK